MASVFIRTILIYLVLIFTLRLSGKRQIGEMQLSELVTTFLLSELASVPLVDPATPFLYAIVPIFTLISLEIILSFLTTKSAAAKRLLDDRPSVIIRHGVLCKEEMGRVRLSMDDLLCELRLKDVACIDEVDYAILEANGKISVFKKDAAPLSHALVIDGVIQKDALSQAGKSEEWIGRHLQKAGAENTDGIFLL